MIQLRPCFNFHVVLFVCVPLVFAGCGGGGSASPTGSSTVVPSIPATVSEPISLRLSAGYGYSLFLSGDGFVWGWGRNSVGQVGNGSNADVPKPAQLPGVGGITEIAAGSLSSAALRSDGSVWVWGRNTTGNLGTASSDMCVSAGGASADACAKAPIRINELSAVVAISSGVEYMAAVRADGTVWGWGGLYAGGTIGNGVPVAPNTTPRQVAGLADIKSVAIGSGHALALRKDSAVFGWGYNIYGQLGTPVVGALLPQQVVGLADVSSIAAGGYQSLALKKDGRVFAWGSSVLEVARSIPRDMNVSGGVAIAAGGNHAMVLKSDGTVWAWGRNDFGQVGDGTRVDVVAPVQVTGLASVVAISAGDTHSLALTRDGSIWAWGQIDPQSVSEIDKCTFTYRDTHGTSPTGNTVVYDVPCAKRPVKVLFTGV